MNKKRATLMLSMVLTLGSCNSIYAASSNIVGKDNKIKYIVDKGYVSGYGKGNLGLENPIKRSEMTKLITYAAGQKDLEYKIKNVKSKYNDVKVTYWANGVINAASIPLTTNGQQIIKGYPNGSFKPENNITYAELAKMLVVLVKTDLTEDEINTANKAWPQAWIDMAKKENIFDDVNVKDVKANANRSDAFTMFYNAINKLESDSNYEKDIEKVYKIKEVEDIKNTYFLTDVKETSYTLKDLKPEIELSMFGNLVTVKKENIPQDLKNEISSGKSLYAKFIGTANDGSTVEKTVLLVPKKDGNFETSELDIIGEDIQKSIEDSKIIVQ